MSQHMEALAASREPRMKRASLKREVKAGERSAAEVLREHPVPDWLRTMHVEELLLLTRSIRSDTVHSMLAAVPIKPAATLGDLTYRKRHMLALELASWELTRAERAARKKQQRSRSAKSSISKGALKAERLG